MCGVLPPRLILVFITSLLIALIGIRCLTRSFAAWVPMTPRFLIKSFMIPYFIGTFFVSMPVVGNAALRSGDSIFPAVVMTIAALINAAINPFLIFGLADFRALNFLAQPLVPSWLMSAPWLPEFISCTNAA